MNNVDDCHYPNELYESDGNGEKSAAAQRMKEVCSEGREAQLSTVTLGQILSGMQDAFMAP
jgi:hypothetical protein